MMPRVWHMHDPERPLKNTVYIGRPTKWGNPYSHRATRYAEVIVVESVEEAIKQFVMHMTPEFIEQVKAELRGKHLMCWCKPGKCHGDILLELANED